MAHRLKIVCGRMNRTHPCELFDDEIGEHQSDSEAAGTQVDQDDGDLRTPKRQAPVSRGFPVALPENGHSYGHTYLLAGEDNLLS